ncbi:hypothetical protein RF11_07174 [Thelohanellus kitauei]|uniref:Uncharacterized protein n=1 Tax=Thelohanellus kitauei TaxID=669202 RepID=A0A0C2N3K4_THEKT|nr:hypothetical protein RF11_07174 [Thelohanellus kitauei]
MAEEIQTLDQSRYLFLCILRDYICNEEATAQQDPIVEIIAHCSCEDRSGKLISVDKCITKVREDIGHLLEAAVYHDSLVIDIKNRQIQRATCTSLSSLLFDQLAPHDADLRSKGLETHTRKTKTRELTGSVESDWVIDDSDHSPTSRPLSVGDSSLLKRSSDRIQMNDADLCVQVRAYQRPTIEISCFEISPIQASWKNLGP